MRTSLAIAAALLASCCSGGGTPPPRIPAGDAASSRSVPAASALAELVLSPHGACGVTGQHRIACWGTWGGDVVTVPDGAQGLDDVAELRIGSVTFADPQPHYDHFCVRHTGGGVSCWGNNLQRQAGVDEPSDPTSPQTLAGVDGAAQLALGATHSCALLASGQVWCWGDNRHGQAGAAAGTEVVPTPRRVGELSDVAALVAGAENSCALTRDRRVYCWGYDINGQSSAKTAIDPPIVWAPVEIEGARGAAQLAAGASTICARTSDGTVVCWGYLRRILGPAFADQLFGTVEGVAGAVDLAVGRDHACAVVARGVVLCWGLNDLGQLGNGSRAGESLPPHAVELPGPATQVVAAEDNTCARLEDRRWYCWGGNVRGEISDPKAGRQPSPIPLDLARVRMTVY